MKLEIEITEDEIRSAIERKVRVSIADISNSYKGRAEMSGRYEIEDTCPGPKVQK